jgi:hypothetical protein
MTDRVRFEHAETCALALQPRLGIREHLHHRGLGSGSSGRTTEQGDVFTAEEPDVTCVRDSESGPLGK